MAVSLPNGGTFAIASAYVASVVISDISNANPAVITTSTAHGLVVGDIIEVSSGWSKLNGKVVRVASAPTATTATLEGINTSSTSLYPAGGGAGSLREVSTFVQLSQILGTSTQGGEQQFATYQFLEADQESQIPTSKSAQSVTLTIADDPTLPGYIVAKAANDDRAVRAVRFRLANGSTIYYNGYVSINETPTTTANEVMSVQATISLAGTPTRYAA